MKELKRIFKQKTTWTGIATVATGIGIAIEGELVEGLKMILSGLGIIFIREAIAKQKKGVMYEKST